MPEAQEMSRIRELSYLINDGEFCRLRWVDQEMSDKQFAIKIKEVFNDAMTQIELIAELGAKSDHELLKRLRNARGL